MKAKEIWTGDGGNNPGWGYKVPFVSKIRIESSASLHSSELTVECGRYGGGLIVWQAIKVRDPDTTAALFFGRIDDIRPISSGSRGMLWRIHARDFMSTLTDNLVGHKLYHAWYGSMIPNWRLDCQEGQTAGQGACGMPREWVVRDLALGVKQGFTDFVCPGTWASGDTITPNYLESSGVSIFDAIHELAEGHPYVVGSPSQGVGYDFRQEFSRQPPIFEYFKKSSVQWNANRMFIWKPPDGSSQYIPIISYDAEREGSGIYSRVFAAGHGDFSPHYRENIPGVGWRDWGGSADPAKSDIRAAGMDDIWNPPEWGSGGKSYRVQREIYVHDEAVQDSKVLEAMAVAKLRSEDVYKGMVASSFSVAGIPINSQSRPPLPGDIISVHLPDLPYQNYVVDKWVYEEPPGISTFTIGRRPMGDIAMQMLIDRSSRVHLEAAARRGWTSPWWATESGRSYYWIDHGLGIVPRNVSISFAKHTGADSFANPLSDSQILTKTVAVVPAMYADPNLGKWVGFNIIENTCDRFGFFLSDWVGYSRLAASGNLTSDGWCQRGAKTAIRITLEA